MVEWSAMDKLRTKLILDYLRKKKTCTFRDLQDRFGISSATIHRDARELARRDAVRVVRGGLVWNDAAPILEPASAYADRIVANRTDKIGAARQALAQIAEGDIIFLDSSTTVFELARLLRTSPITHLTIITNALAIMQDFRKFPREWVLIGLGGTYDGQLNSILGATVLHQLTSLNITKAFLSAFGLDAHAATTNHERQAELLRAVVASAQASYLLVDRTKIGRTGIYRLAPRTAFRAVFT